jgi:hypothetical protein
MTITSRLPGRFKLLQLLVAGVFLEVWIDFIAPP